MSTSKGRETTVTKSKEEKQKGKRVNVRMPKHVLTQLTTDEGLSELPREILSRTCAEIAKGRLLKDIFPNYDIENGHPKNTTLSLRLTEQELNQIIAATIKLQIPKARGLSGLIYWILSGTYAELAKNRSLDDIFSEKTLQVDHSPNNKQPTPDSVKTKAKTKVIRRDTRKAGTESETIGIYGDSQLHAKLIRPKQEEIQNAGNNALIILEDGNYPAGVKEEMLNSVQTYINLFTVETVNSKTGKVVKKYDGKPNHAVAETTET
jgi:hypothetical protein